ncbi:hypothetical protein BBOV_I005014 [Babesia bovis T2Bo]|uniref:hypothetical protein n=1 Tax=Babesia bovis T2Bo TaxID=484906 RepID=UPI001C3600B9|nr:hypothetical protein BBOV_I005014 [Babesia bovis T2Bo]KAG6440226.1 hypothetical protein BBOV_I005014 [Babesia bovis T2Bo]
MYFVLNYRSTQLNVSSGIRHNLNILYTRCLYMSILVTTTAKRRQTNAIIDITMKAAWLFSKLFTTFIPKSPAKWHKMIRQLTG